MTLDLPIRPINKAINKSIAAIKAAMGKLCCTVEPTLRFPINFGTNVPPNKPIENIIPKIVPYRLGSNLAKVTPTIVGKIGAKASPISRTARIPRAGPLAKIIRKIDASERIDAKIITFEPIAVRFLIAEVRNLPAIMVTPNKLSTSPAFVEALIFSFLQKVLP